MLCAVLAGAALLRLSEVDWVQGLWPGCLLCRSITGNVNAILNYNFRTDARWSAESRYQWCSASCLPSCNACLGLLL